MAKTASKFLLYLWTLTLVTHATCTVHKIVLRPVLKGQEDTQELRNASQPVDETRRTNGSEYLVTLTEELEQNRPEIRSDHENVTRVSVENVIASASPITLYTTETGTRATEMPTTFNNTSDKGTNDLSRNNIVDQDQSNAHIANVLEEDKAAPVTQQPNSTVVDALQSLDEDRGSSTAERGGRTHLTALERPLPMVTSDDEPQPCPPGCRCLNQSPHDHRNKWHNLLVSFRTRQLVYGYKEASVAFKPNEDANIMSKGRRMICVGLPDVPSFVPSDISQVNLYGNLRTSWEEQMEHPDDDNFVSDFELSDVQSGTLMQLTNIDKLNNIQSSEVKHLSIEGNRIKAIEADDFYALNNLKHLKLRNNRLRVIDRHSFRGLTSATEIDLAENHIKHLPQAVFKDVTKLRKLDLSKNRITSLDEDQLINNLELEHLNLDHNALADLPDKFFFLKSNIRHLSLAENNLQLIKPAWLNSLPNVEKLNLKGNSIFKLENNMFRNYNLTLLNLDNNDVQELVAGCFNNMSGLLILRLQENNIAFIERGVFETLPNLEELRLDGNDLKVLIPQTFMGLDSLQILTLSENKIHDISNGLFRLIPRLQKLDLSHNEIKIIGNRTFYGLMELRDLRLNHNRIKVIENEGFAVSSMQHYSTLTYLQLNYNQLSSVPRHMFKGLSFLKFLNLGHNQIEDVDDGGLSMLLRLNTLILNGNRITTFKPGTFKQLILLRHANFGGNKLSHLEFNAFLGLQAIEDLTLQNNELQNIENEVFLDTPSLISLNLAKNKLKHINFDLLDVLAHLKYLDVSQNEVRDIRLPSSASRSLFSLSIADNYLARLSANVTNLITRRGNLQLYGNPWYCDCEIKWFLDVQETEDVKLGFAEDITCKAPLRLAGEKMLFLLPEDLECKHYPLLEKLLSADEAVTTRQFNCSFNEFGREHTRQDIKETKEEVLPWVVTLINPKDGGIQCLGVRLDHTDVLIPSFCSKRLQPGDKMNFALGQTSSLQQQSEVQIKELTHYPGGMDIAVLTVMKRKQLLEEHDFPCVLDNMGEEEAVSGKSHAVIATVAMNVKAVGKVKIRTYPAKTIAVPCVSGMMCLQMRREKFRKERTWGDESPVFVKIGKTNWAFVGFAKFKGYGNWLVQPVHTAIDWIRQIS